MRIGGIYFWAFVLVWLAACYFFDVPSGVGGGIAIAAFVLWLNPWGQEQIGWFALGAFLWFFLAKYTERALSENLWYVAYMLPAVLPLAGIAAQIANPEALPGTLVHTVIERRTAIYWTVFACALACALAFLFLVDPPKPPMDWSRIALVPIVLAVLAGAFTGCVVGLTRLGWSLTASLKEYIGTAEARDARMADPDELKRARIIDEG